MAGVKRRRTEAEQEEEREVERVQVERAPYDTENDDGRWRAETSEPMSGFRDAESDIPLPELICDLCRTFYTLGWVTGTGGGPMRTRGCTVGATLVPTTPPLLLVPRWPFGVRETLP